MADSFERCIYADTCDLCNSYSCFNRCIHYTTVKPLWMIFEENRRFREQRSPRPSYDYRLYNGYVREPDYDEDDEEALDDLAFRGYEYSQL